MMKRASLLLLALTLSTGAFAQDDDDLVPLAPLGKVKPKPKAKPKPKPKAKPKQKPIVDDDDLAPISPIVAKAEVSVKLASALSGAVLSIDGKEVGTLPLPSQSVTPGEHSLTVKRPGYASFVKKLLVPGGKLIEVEAKLTPVAAVLSVTSDVAGAQVLLNGRSIGTAPLTEVEVPAGPAEIEVVKEGYSESRQKLTLVAGKDYPVSVKFQPEAVANTDKPLKNDLTPALVEPGPAAVVSSEPEPVWKKWDLWVGIGVAVAVGGLVPGIVGVVIPGEQHKQFCKDVAGADVYMNFSKTTCTGLLIPGL